jgi:hypothetical protein
MAQLTLPPDYFRTAAEKYKLNPSNRKIWLADQVKKSNESLLQYQVEINSLLGEAVRLGATAPGGQTVSVIGGVIAAIPLGYTQVIGGVLIVAGSLFSKLENKQKAKRVEDIRTVAVARYNEAVAVGIYYEDYKKELLFQTVIPWILAALFLLLILK